MGRVVWTLWSISPQRSLCVGRAALLVRARLLSPPSLVGMAPVPSPSVAWHQRSPHYSVGWEHSQDTGSWMAIIHAALEEKSDFAPCKATRQNPEQKSGAEPSYIHVACVLHVIGMSWYTLP